MAATTGVVAGAEHGFLVSEAWEMTGEAPQADVPSKGILGLLERKTPKRQIIHEPLKAACPKQDTP